MSDVRLSNASPTVERVDPRPQDAARPSVCRALFGRPDPESTRRLLTEVISDGVRDFRERYNFDPVTDRPLSGGNFEWEESYDSPEFYRRGVHLRGVPQRAEQGAAPELRDDRRKRPAEDSEPCSAHAKKSRSGRDGGDDDDDGSPPGAAGCSALAVSEEPVSSAESVSERLK